MTPLESGRAKIAAGNYSLTPAEMQAMAVASAENNPVMVPVERKEPVTRASSRMNAELIEQILDITIGHERSEARAALARLFEAKAVSVAIDKTWDNEDAYKTVRTGA